ncbi:MAG: aminopeptidase P family protein [Bacilli bacterium]|nr:aminopeptidase P family protein [Bacilli bacterium]MBN2877070.1 aminopeptidase P family protein [Bacilli bacterium]
MKQMELVKRRSALLKEMKDSSLALFASGKAPFKSKDQNYPFTVDKNFYYLTGLVRENFILLLLKSNDKRSTEFLFIEEPSDYATKWLGSRMTKEETSEISGIPLTQILYTKDFESFVSKAVLIDSRGSLGTVPKHLYLDLFRQYVMEKPRSLTQFRTILKSYPELRLKDANAILDELRRIKSDSEVQELRTAIEYTNQAILAMMKAVKPGMNECNLDALFEFKIKDQGSKGTSFATIIASGPNGTTLHYEDNNCDIEDGMLVLTDLGALSNVYGADITRTYPANGKFTERQKQIYEIVLNVNKTIIDKIKPGVNSNELNALATDMLAEGLMKIGKIQDKTEITKYYYHGIGHYLGLDVHDVGTYSKPLEEGVVITVEPGLYLADEGIGIRIEDDVLVTKTGSENLSKQIIKEIDEIEAFMKK